MVSLWDRTTSRLAGFRRNSPSFDEAASAAPVEERVGDEKQRVAPKPSAPRRRSGLRIAVFASIAVVLVAAITVGSLEAVQHLGKDQPIVVITDDTIGISPGSTGQSTPTTAAEATAGKAAAGSVYHWLAKAGSSVSWSWTRPTLDPLRRGGVVRPVQVHG